MKLSIYCHFHSRSGIVQIKVQDAKDNTNLGPSSNICWELNKNHVTAIVNENLIKYGSCALYLCAPLTPKNLFDFVFGTIKIDFEHQF